MPSCAPSLPHARPRGDTTDRAGRAGRLRGLARGHAADAAWVRPVLLGVLAVSAVLVLWHLSSSGYSNTYYAAAVRSASESWKAWFFGSLDPGSFITVDKPPLSTWLMGLSVRVFGFSSFAMLLPQALCTVAAVGLLFSTVRRLFGPTAGLLAAGALALTPITVAVGRVNNPDALMVLLLVAATWMVVKALESGRTRQLVLAGAFVGLAFMTKMLAGWMIAPALALAYGIAGPPKLGARLTQLLAAGASMVAVSAAWPLAVTLWPGSAPYVGGSTDGSAWDLILGYNGLGRIFGEGGAGGGGGASFGGPAGLWRMFDAQVGGQASWLIPVAAVSVAAGLWLTRRAARTDLARAGWILFGVWAVVLAGVFSTQQGTFHPYYVSALAPAYAALGGAGLVTLARWARDSWAGVVVLDLAVLSTAAVAVMLLKRADGFQPWLLVAVPAAAGIAVFASVALRAPGLLGRRGAAIALVAATFAMAAGPAAYSVATMSHGLNGNNVLAGPSSATSGSFGGGMDDGGAVSADTVTWLQEHQGSATYLFAASGSQATADVIIATGEAVVTMGGFRGSDNAPTVSQLEQLVASGRLKYVLLSGGGMGDRGGSSEVSAWVTAHGTDVSDAAGVANGTLYALTA